ncbi:MAG TPA: Gfo/Idh/MocA family oxidoreductase [Dongiaceae bacterium]|nr:Gfo/Idh/MocA family oxidoreductase [Dongiaceae bacterium]
MAQVAAVIGAGFVGRAHIEALRRIPIPVRGTMVSSGERTAAAAKALGLERAYSSVEEICADPAVTAVHICTPNYVHFEQAAKLMRAGKHVLCEKPLAMDSRESAALMEIAKETKRVGGVAHNLRYYPLCLQARALVESGAIGQVKLIHGGFLQDWLTYPTDWNWRLESKLGGELRAVSDIGTHWMDLVQWITGQKIEELCADLATVVPVRQKPRGHVESFSTNKNVQTDEVPITTDDYASVLVHFDHGAKGVFTVSQVSAGRKCKLNFEINGTEGSLAWNAEEPNLLWIGRRNEANGSLIKDPSLLAPSARKFAAYPGGHAEGYPDTFVQLFRAYYEYLDAGNFNAPKPFPTFETGHDELLLCEAIQKSAETRAWTKVSA